MQHGLIEADAGPRDEVVPEPVRARAGVRGDDDLVGGEEAEGVRDRLERVAVADLAAGVDARGPQPVQRPGKALLRGAARAVAVRRPLGRGRVENRRDDGTSPPTFRARKRIASCSTVPIRVSFAITRIRRPCTVASLRSTAIPAPALRGVEVTWGLGNPAAV